jgi:hypothetical protein
MQVIKARGVRDSSVKRSLNLSGKFQKGLLISQYPTVVKLREPGTPTPALFLRRRRELPVLMIAA